MNILDNHTLAPGQKAYIAKKGRKYITTVNGELATTAKQGRALVFPTLAQAQGFFDTVGFDTRNARVLGRSYALVELTGKDTPQPELVHQDQDSI